MFEFEFVNSLRTSTDPRGVVAIGARSRPSLRCVSWITWTPEDVLPPPDEKARRRLLAVRLRNPWMRESLERLANRTLSILGDEGYEVVDHPRLQSRDPFRAHMGPVDCRMEVGIEPRAIVDDRIAAPTGSPRDLRAGRESQCRRPTKRGKPMYTCSSNDRDQKCRVTLGKKLSQ